MTAGLTTEDRTHQCGCVTFWRCYNGKPAMSLYRKACGVHRFYAERLGILVVP